MGYLTKLMQNHCDCLGPDLTKFWDQLLGTRRILMGNSLLSLVNILVFVCLLIYSITICNSIYMSNGYLLLKRSV